MAYNRAIHVFWDFDFRCRHNGCILAAKDRGLTLRKLEEGDFLVYFNAKLDRIMILAPVTDGSLGVLASYKSPKGRIRETDIQKISKAFGGGAITYADALRRVIQRRLGGKAEDAKLAA